MTRVAAILFAALAVAPLPEQARRPATAHPKFKAIFEPVNYSEDVEFTDVSFADKDTGWACGHHRTAAGEGGFIIATRDGGKTWSLQVGDPNSSARDFGQLFFLDATHGWATEWDGKLLQTKDGSTWEPVGDFQTLRPFTFVSPDRGFALDGAAQNILATADGGRTWKTAYHCRAKVDVQGLPHEQDCVPEVIAFAPDHTTGYVITRALDNGSSAVLRTADAGATWTIASFVPQADAKDGALFFSDAATGFLRAGGALRATSDGGQTWHAVPASVPGGVPKVIFAGPVGWMVESNDFAYTTDGGRRWNSRKIDFPTHVVRFSLPAPDRGYVVGSHGMVYRYRVVPFDFTVPHMLAAPAMTASVP